MNRRWKISFIILGFLLFLGWTPILNLLFVHYAPGIVGSLAAIAVAYQIAMIRMFLATLGTFLGFAMLGYFLYQKIWRQG